jgi:serine/threonine protein kinase
LYNSSQWPANVTSKENAEEITYYSNPRVSSIKIIDFGGATFKQDYHGSIINTRQYRGPEVILQCCQWDEKSDIWSAACILFELYTGDMLFPTHNSIEHLALIIKLIGEFPEWMVISSSKEMRECFRQGKNNARIWELDWPACLPRDVSIKSYNDMKPIEVITQVKYRMRY